MSEEDITHFDNPKEINKQIAQRLSPNFSVHNLQFIEPQKNDQPNLNYFLKNTFALPP